MGAPREELWPCCARVEERSHGPTVLVLTASGLRLGPVLTGCAQQPARAGGHETSLAAAQTRRFGVTRHVLAMAGSLGYRHERMRSCQDPRLTGSIIAVARRIDAAHLQFRV